MMLYLIFRCTAFCGGSKEDKYEEKVYQCSSRCRNGALKLRCVWRS